VGTRSDWYRGLRSSSTKRLILLVVAGLIAVGVAVVIRSGGSAKSGFYNMTTLQSDLESQLDQKIVGQKDPTGSSPFLFVRSVQCFQTGAQAAECHVTLNNGSTQNVAVDIAANGNQYMTH